MRMVHAATFLELTDRAEQAAVGVGSGAYHELHGHARGAAGMKRVPRLPLSLRLPLQDYQLLDPLEVLQRGREALLRRDPGQTGAARRLEVERDPAGQGGETVDLRGFASRHHLHVDIAAEPVPFPQQLEDLDEIVHHFHRATRDPGGDEQSLAPSALMSRQENAHQLFRLEQSPRHRPIPPHGAVMAVVAAGVGHEDAQQGHPHSGCRVQVPDIERPKRSYLPGVLETGRQPLAVIDGKRHQSFDLLFERWIPQHRGASWWGVLSLPE
jgi:hypothetical protein